MPRRLLESLGVMVREKRASRKLRETAHEIGISPATLLRVESGRIPDVETFGRLCSWLKVNPGDFLGIEPSPEIPSQEPSHTVIDAHLKFEKTPKAETVQALVRMILLALATQPGFSDTNG